MANTPPGVVVAIGTQPAKQTSPTDTGVAFLPILSDRAPANPKLLDDISDFPGSKVASSVSWDWLDVGFREGGVDSAYVQVVTGPAAAAATVNVPGTSGTGLVVTARDKGEYANGAAGGLSVQVADGTGGSGTKTLILKRNGVEIDRSTDYTTNQGAVDYYANHPEVVVALGGGSGLTPVMVATNLAGGSTDRGSIVLATHVAAAIDKFGSNLGPGNIACPDWRTDAAHLLIGAHAQARNRFAVPDCDDGASKSTLLAAQAAIQGAVDDGYSAGIPTSWFDAPPAAAGGTARAIPASAVFCARAATVDATPGDGPAQAPAGDWGKARYCTGVRTQFTADTIAGVNDVGDLDAAGCNWIRMDDGTPTIYGFNTSASRTGADAEWSQVGTARYRMSLQARLAAAGKPYFAKKLNRRTLEGFELDVNGILLGDYNNGDLYGDPADDRPGTAFAVSTDPPVNTDATLNQGRLRVKALIRPVKGGRLVEIDVTALALTDKIAA